VTAEVRLPNQMLPKKRGNKLIAVRRVLFRKWLCYLLVGSALLTFGGALFFETVVSTAWHLIHGNYAQLGQWDIPVPQGWWAFTGTGVLIVQHMHKSPDMDSNMVFADLPRAAGSIYDYEKRRDSVRYMLREGYQFFKENKTRLSDQDCHCMSFFDNHDTKRIRIMCDVPSVGLSLSFSGDRRYAPEFESVIQHITKTNQTGRLIR